MSALTLSTATESELRSALKLSFLKDAAEAELAKREAQKLEDTKAALASLVESGATIAGVHYDFLSLVNFVQRTLAVEDTDHPSVWSVVSEARAALGNYQLPGLGKFKSLNALKELAVAE